MLIIRGRTLIAALVSITLSATATSVLAQENSNPVAAMPWKKGDLQLGSKAVIQLDDDAVGLLEADSGKFLEYTGNLATPGSSIVMGRDWWAVFGFTESGYVKDDDKIDAEALLKELKDSDGPSNEERKKHGLAQLQTDGWYVPPHYDQSTKQLEWGLRIHAIGDPNPVINYTVRILGRHGYEHATLVSSPENLDRDVAQFKSKLAKFDFNQGERYSEFKPGDHVAEFGLAALVAGGAAAVATKTGFWKVLAGALAAGWKIIVGIFVAGLAAIKNIFKRNK